MARAQGRKGGISKMAVGAGVAAGAAIGAATAAALTNKDTRKAIGQKLDEFKDIAIDTVSDLQKQAAQKRGKIQEEIPNQLKTARRKLSRRTH